MRQLMLLVAILFSGTIAAQDVDQALLKSKTAIDRGLGFLVKDGMQWKADHSCVSCHHASLSVWALNEAVRRNFSVDETFLTDMTKWIAESGDGKTSQPRPQATPKALNTKALYHALALASSPKPNDLARQGLLRMLVTLRGDQLPDGSWSAWPETRPPIFGDSNENMTALATLALTASAEIEEGSSDIRSPRDQGIDWLARTISNGDSQAIALRLVIWQKTGRSNEEIAKYATQIKSRQNGDGGWSQAPAMPSDAWATGQSLYALAHSGLNLNDPIVARGHLFLIQTQREDGSWPMRSLPAKPGGEPSSSLIPIIGAGSAWAVIGLVRSL